MLISHHFKHGDIKARESEPLSKGRAQARPTQGTGDWLHHVGKASLIVFFWAGLVFCADASLDLPSHLHCWPGECEEGRAIWRMNTLGKASPHPLPHVDSHQTAAKSPGTGDRWYTGEKEERNPIPHRSEWYPISTAHTGYSEAGLRNIFSMIEHKDKPCNPLHA